MPKYLRIRGFRQSEFRCVKGVVAELPQPLGEVGRERHVDKEFHEANSTVSSSASEAA